MISVLLDGLATVAFRIYAVRAANSKAALNVNSICMLLYGGYKRAQRRL